LERSVIPWKTAFRLTRFSAQRDASSALAVDPTQHKLYVMNERMPETEFDWYDRHSHAFHPYLPGIFAHYLDFSRDGRWIVYLRGRGNELWVARVDGSNARQIPAPGMIDMQLPRWSPDGTQIAFMGKRVNAPYRIFIVRFDGQNLREASRGTDNQGAPTWSPDGRFLVYGRVLCQEERTCAIVRISLGTGGESLVPGSEGLSTARWSPDGGFIAALRSDTHQVYLLDLHNQKWRVVADGANGNDLSWSPDSQTIYTSRPSGDRPEVLGISREGGKQARVVDLSDFSKLGGRVDTWFSVTPDNSIVFLHVLGGQNIYAIRYSEK
jgi:WD40 repeat protein